MLWLAEDLGLRVSVDDEGELGKTGSHARLRRNLEAYDRDMAAFGGALRDLARPRAKTLKAPSSRIRASSDRRLRRWQPTAGELAKSSRWWGGWTVETRPGGLVRITDECRRAGPVHPADSFTWPTNSAAKPRSEQGSRVPNKCRFLTILPEDFIRISEYAYSVLVKHIPMGENQSPEGNFQSPLGKLRSPATEFHSPGLDSRGWLSLVHSQPGEMRVQPLTICLQLLTFPIWRMRKRMPRVNLRLRPGRLLLALGPALGTNPEGICSGGWELLCGRCFFQSRA